MSVLEARPALGPGDYAFIERALDDFPYAPDLDWKWMSEHLGKEAFAMMLEEDGEGPLQGFLVYQPMPDRLWVLSLYTLNNVGRKHDWGIARICSDIAQHYRLGAIGFRSLRRGWGRVLMDRLGLNAEEVEHEDGFEFRINLPLLGD
jgi:hypothetical protein